MHRTRPITFSIPSLWKAADLHMDVVVAESGKPPVWPKEGAHTATAMVGDGQTAHFALCNKDGQRVLHGSVRMEHGSVWLGSERVFPVIGHRPLTDIQIIPGFCRYTKESR